MCVNMIILLVNGLDQCFPTDVPRNLKVLSAGAKISVRNLGKHKLINNIFYLNYDLNIEKLQKSYGGSTKRSSSCKGSAS
jgi:hypothetical protein